MPTTTFATALGVCALAWNDAGLTGFFLPGAYPGFPDAATHDFAPPSWIATLVTRVQRHLNGEAEDFADLPYDFGGMPAFQRAVLQATLTVKSGHTATYGEIAATLGQPPGASRAVGTALGANPWPLLIPCHRIVAANGKMTGFSGPGGIATKTQLLALEGARLL